MIPHFENLVPDRLDQVAAALDSSGWLQADRAAECLVELRRLWEEGGGIPELPPEWYVVLGRVLQESASPTLMLGSVCEFVRATQSTDEAFALFTESPRSLEILRRFSSGSPFLTQVLLRNPNTLPFLARYRKISELKSREEFCVEARRFQDASFQPALVSLRLYQRRELLRIGMCDVFGLLGLRHVTLQLSLLADAMVRLCLKEAMRDSGRVQPPFAVLALGKHGGEELNYSSDIDLVLVGKTSDRHTQSVARRMIDGLSEHFETGFLYRVDLRLRPWGRAGPIVTTTESWFEYLTDHAQLWEKQALLKARFVTGDEAVADRLLSEVPQLLFTESADSVRAGIRSMKDQVEARLRHSSKNRFEVKLGIGSIRDIEFLVQSLQLIHGSAEPRVASANTLDALVRLADFGLLPAADYQQLRDGYVFLRAIEHALQLQHNRQTFTIPEQPELREWLALRIDYPNAETFMSRFDEHRRAIRLIFDRHFRPDSGTPSETYTAVAARRSDVGGMEIGSWPCSSERPAAVAMRSVLQVAVESQSLAVDLVEIGPGQAVLLICVPDEPEMLTRISGVVFSLGFDIRRGIVTTGPAPMDDFAIPAGLFAARLSIDSPSPVIPAGETARLIHERIGQLLLTTRTRGIDVMREELIGLFCARMQAIQRNDFAQSDLQVLDRSAADSSATIVSIRSADNPGFLFELSSALNLCGFRIRRARIDVEKNQVRDELSITESSRRSVLTEARIQEVHTTVTLIQQFMLWLPASADPGPVLLRFRRLLQSLSRETGHAHSALILRKPDVLQRVARVLGLSRHLWEDALQDESHLIMFLGEPELLSSGPGLSELRLEVQTALGNCSRSSQSSGAAEVLNRIKDRHLFRIELRHVLGHCRDFDDFSREITTLAEISLETAAEIAWRELSQPAASAGRVPDCRWTLAGLGKFGGVEMGYGSDVELLLVFEGEDSPHSARWFEQLLTKTTELLVSRRDGIFEIDLRMRPWGQAGSAAVSIEQFESYYSRTGSAWPYERQALIKMRSFGPDAVFGQRLMAVRDHVVYDDRPFDFAAMNGLRELQMRQHVQPGTIHAKLSDGCLVDIEYSVQALQLMLGGRHAALRTANTLAALQAAQRIRLLPEELYRSSRSAYVYFRQLIDCLRMVRGNAKDLQLPVEGSADQDQLDRRLAQIYTDRVSLSGLEQHRTAVRCLMTKVQDVCDASGFTNSDRE